jgi:hypothetical protein
MQDLRSIRRKLSAIAKPEVPNCAVTLRDAARSHKGIYAVLSP